jgi:adenosylcobinamide amidohydrolase
VNAVSTAGAAAVVVVSHLPSQRRPAVDALRAVTAARCQAFYAGNAFTFASARTGVPGTYLGEHLSGAATLVQQCLDDLAGRPSR